VTNGRRRRRAVEFVDTRNNKRSGKVQIKPVQVVAGRRAVRRPYWFAVRRRVSPPAMSRRRRTATPTIPSSPPAINADAGASVTR